MLFKWLRIWLVASLYWLHIILDKSLSFFSFILYSLSSLLLQLPKLVIKLRSHFLSEFVYLFIVGLLQFVYKYIFTVVPLNSFLFEFTRKLLDYSWMVLFFAIDLLYFFFFDPEDILLHFELLIFKGELFIALYILFNLHYLLD